MAPPIAAPINGLTNLRLTPNKAGSVIPSKQDAAGKAIDFFYYFLF